MDAYDLSFLEAQEIARHVPEAIDREPLGFAKGSGLRTTA